MASTQLQCYSEGMNPPTNLSEALDHQSGTSSHTVLVDGSHLVTINHGRSWRVGFRITSQPKAGRGQLDVSDVAVRHVGSGRMAAQDVRNLPIGKLLAQARNLVSGSLAVPSTVVAGIEFVDIDSGRLAAFLVDGRGGPKRTDADYAKLALVYALLVESGSRSPAKALHERHGHGSPAVWANRVSDARKRGLLSKIPSGESGGHLTAKAERLLGFR